MEDGLGAWLRGAASKGRASNTKRGGTGQTHRRGQLLLVEQVVVAGSVKAVVSKPTVGDVTTISLLGILTGDRLALAAFAAVVAAAVASRDSITPPPVRSADVSVRMRVPATTAPLLVPISIVSPALRHCAAVFTTTELRALPAVVVTVSSSPFAVGFIHVV